MSGLMERASGVEDTGFSVPFLSHIYYRNININIFFLSFFLSQNFSLFKGGEKILQFLYETHFSFHL